MKSAFLITLIMVCLNTSSWQDNLLSTTQMNRQETEILRVVKNWNESFQRNDPETYFGYIHDSLTLFIPSSPYRIDGKRDDREEFEWSLGTERTKVSLFQELQPLVQILDGSTAVVTYHTRGAYGPDGQQQIIYLKETNVLVKENNEWKIIHIHVSK